MDHAWKLVAPWWFWSPADDPQSGRQSAPQLQMFAADDFIEGFLKRPQHGLRFKDDEDRVHSVNLLGSGLAQVPTLAQLQADPQRVRLVASATRKLFLPVHGRHYLVSASLHCDAREFPPVDPAQVCGSGFVVRRLSSPVPAALERELAGLQQQAELAQAELDELNLRGPLRAHLAWMRRRRLEALERGGLLHQARLAAQQKAALAQAALGSWKARHGITQQVEVWVADADDPDLGDWQPLRAEQQLAGHPAEHHYPLRRLHAPPDQPLHEASGRTLFFGAVPTTSSQRDRSGQPRFDDRALYEIRCFVTRRRPACQRPRGASGCQGQRVWSAPTEAFRLASPMDPVGCAKRPIVLRMPDLRELLAHAVARPRGALSNVRVVHAQQISPMVKAGQPQKGTPGGAAFCHFSIPLITIVAMFVLNLFLPIVVLLFQLWFLLAFRFCIPPSISASVEIDAAAKITNLLPPSGDFSLGLEVDGNPLTQAEVRDALQLGLQQQWQGDMGDDAGDAALGLPDPDLSRDTRNAMDNRSLPPAPPLPGGQPGEPGMPSPPAPAPSDYLDHPQPQQPRVLPTRSLA
jgi:hypothetical protein